MQTVVLPDHGEIMRRLASVNDSPWNVEHLYPVIAEEAGVEKVGFGLPLMFELAIEGVGGSGPLESTLRLQVPAWLRALVDEPEVLTEALAMFYEIHPYLNPDGRG